MSEYAQMKIFLFKGTCSDPTPVNGIRTSIDQQPLPNGTYRIGTNAQLTCNFSLYHPYGDPYVRCMQPGIWVGSYNSPHLQCIPYAQGQY